MDFTKKLFREVGADAMLTESSDLRFYLTGYPSSFGFVYTDAQESILFTDPRYAESAKAAMKGQYIGVEIARSADAVLDYIKSKKIKKLAVPFERTTVPQMLLLRKYGFKPVDSMPAFIDAMEVKSEEESALIARACSVAEEAYIRLLAQLKEGMTENDTAALLEYEMRRCGAEDRSFETIAAFGANTSVPHHHPDQTGLKKGMPVLLDFGCKVGGYCSDITRTFLFGKGDVAFEEAYAAVLSAHNEALSRVRVGMTGREADELARGCLRKKGLDKFFTHSLGHGIGVNIHESPTLGPSGARRLRENMVFSIEPGVYFEGKFGIRIEDTVFLTANGAVSFMKTDKKLTVL